MNRKDVKLNLENCNIEVNAPGLVAFESTPKVKGKKHAILHDD